MFFRRICRTWNKFVSARILWLQGENAAWRQLRALYPLGSLSWERMTLAIAMNDFGVAIYTALQVDDAVIVRE